MLEGYQAHIELNDLDTSDQFAVEVPQIGIYEEQATEPVIEEAAVDTSLIGVPEDRIGEEYEIADISIASLVEAAAIARTAVSLGVVISPERALRAGQIRTGEVVVDPDYRDNGRRSSNSDSQPHEETPEPPFLHQLVEVSETESTDQSLPEAEIAVAAAEDEPIAIDAETVQPAELAIPSDHSRDEEDGGEPVSEEIIGQEVDLPVQPSSGDGGDKPPFDTTPSETGFPDENPDDSETGEESSPQRHFAHGQLREAIRSMARVLTEAGVDVDSMLTPRQKETLPLLVGEMTNEEIATQLGQQPPSISKMSHLIVERMISQAPEDIDLRPLAQPAGHVVPEGPNNSVGAILNAIREQKGITIDSVSEQLDGRSKSAIQRFFAGTSHPHNTQMILPLLQILGVPDEEAKVYLHAYRAERSQRSGKPKDNKT